jgi:hypothetical protein
MMPSLVEELQRDAMDEHVSLGNLLRKALVVATKLKLAEFRKWVEQELKGYTKGPVPDYRHTSGRPTLNCGPYGAKPIVIEDEELADGLSRYVERNSITFVEELVRKGDASGWLYIDYEGQVRDYFLAPYRRMAPGIPQLHIPVTSYVPILHAVRNAILEWSLKLEAEGIVGEGMSFSPQEKEAAQKEAKDLGNPINFIHVEGNMVNSTIQQGSDGAKQRSRIGKTK